MSLTCDLDAPKLITELKTYCTQNFIDQLDVLSNSTNPSLKPIKNILDTNKLKDTRKELDNQRSVLNKLLGLFATKTIQINQVSLQGKSDRISKLRDQIGRDTSAQINYFTTQDLQKKQQEFEKNYNANADKQQSQPTLTKAIVDKIDKIKKVDESTGKISLPQDQLKNLNLTKDQEQLVKRAIDNFNNLNILVRTNTNSMLGEEAKNKNTSNNKVSLMGNLSNNVTVKASGCSSYTTVFYTRTFWYGADFVNTMCGWASAGIYISMIWLAISMTASALCDVGYGLCWVGFWGVQSLIINQAGTAAWKASQCGGIYWGKSVLRIYGWNFWKGGDIDCA